MVLICYLVRGASLLLFDIWPYQYDSTTVNYFSLFGTSDVTLAVMRPTICNVSFFIEAFIRQLESVWFPGVWNFLISDRRVKQRRSSLRTRNADYVLKCLSTSILVSSIIGPPRIQPFLLVQCNDSASAVARLRLYDLNVNGRTKRSLFIGQKEGVDGVRLRRVDNRCYYFRRRTDAR